jgi:hypothetical protein
VRARAGAPGYPVAVNETNTVASWCRAGILLAALGAASAPLAAQLAEARDTVVLTNGKELRCRVLRMNEAEVVVRTGSTDRTLKRQDVRSVDSIAEKHKQLMAIWRNTSPADVRALLELALVARNAGLMHEERLLYWYAALQQPDNESIHQFLGNRKIAGKFLVEIDKKWVPFDKADALGADFDDAWALRSEHFAIRCAGGLRMGLDTLMDLEGLYDSFLDLFGADLGLYELIEPIDVRLYRNRAQMPSAGTFVGAYFLPGEATLYTCIEDGKTYALMHEATHALLYCFLVRAARSRGEVPSWLDEGWAEYMQGRLQQKAPGKPTLKDHSEQPGHLQAMAGPARGELYGVHRLLNFKSGDFSASSRQDLKYAQAWALFRYLFEATDPELKGRFLGYLREVVRGQGQASTFRRIFAADEKRLDVEPWR